MIFVLSLSVITRKVTLTVILNLIQDLILGFYPPKAHDRSERTHNLYEVKQGLSEAQHSRCIAAHSFHKRRSTN